MQIQTDTRAHTTFASTSQPTSFTSVRIIEVELSQALPDLSASNDQAGQTYHKVMCVVRLHTQPLGVVHLALRDNGTLSAHDLAQGIWQELSESINTHLQQDGLPVVTSLEERGLSNHMHPRCIEEQERFLADAPFVSIIVATRDRPERLRSCLTALLVQHYPHYEIIVVDNAPSSSATQEFVEQAYRDIPQIRYVREDRPGLSFARNRGIQAATGEIVAITDDDVVVDAYWLLALARGFTASENVVCVSGLVLPLELETYAQVLFEQFGGYSKGFQRRLIDSGEHHPRTPLFPFTAGSLGTGASIAFQTAFIRQIGGFDPALGIGTLALGGEDLAIFFQIMILGRTIVYEPAAMLYHPNYQSFDRLRRQVYCYGVGLTAYLTRSLMENPGVWFDFIRKLPAGIYFALSPQSSKNKQKSKKYPRELTLLELKGMLYGPLAYLRSRWALRRMQKLHARNQSSMLSTDQHTNPSHEEQAKGANK